MSQEVPKHIPPPSDPDSSDTLSVVLDNVEHIKKTIDNGFEGSEVELKDKLFHEYIKRALIADFFDNLSDFLSQEDVDDFSEVLAERTEEEQFSALSLPHELREKWFLRFEAQIANGDDPKKVAEEYVNTLSKYKFNIGFHTSPYDFRPNPDTESWTIAGSEPDHRDDDRMMAYYSKQYRHLFKKPNSRFVYIVRTNPDHKTDGNWSRSDSLSVIMRIPLKEVVDFVESKE